jgi:hypothetical protein
VRTILIVANETLASPTLASAVIDHLANGPTRFHVVVPATPIVHRLTWEEGETRAAALERLDAVIARLSELGAEASGEIGSSDPLSAVRDALRSQPVDEIILSTLPAGVSRWLRQDVPSRLKGAVRVPITVVTAPRELARAGPSLTTPQAEQANAK